MGLALARGRPLRIRPADLGKSLTCCWWLIILKRTMTRRIYLDNSATSFPKPPAVQEAMADFARNVGASAGRGFYQEAIRSEEIIQQTR